MPHEVIGVSLSFIDLFKKKKVYNLFLKNAAIIVGGKPREDFSMAPRFVGDRNKARSSLSQHRILRQLTKWQRSRSYKGLEAPVGSGSHPSQELLCLPPVSESEKGPSVFMGRVHPLGFPVWQEHGCQHHFPPSWGEAVQCCP